ncbi:MAG: DUF5011 domain-containing protein, partial [Oleispira sp.]|nr:DUF5011 domain-containing protein [Oleispira sp.]
MDLKTQMESFRMYLKDIFRDFRLKTVLMVLLAAFSSFSYAVLDSIDVSDVLVTEGNTATITVTISPKAGADGQIILYEASAETADGDDFTLASNRITIAPNQTTGVINILIPENSGADLNLETFKVGVRADHVLNSGFENGSAGFIEKSGVYKVENKRATNNPDSTHCVLGADKVAVKDWVCSYPYKFETNTVSAYGHTGTNKVLEIDSESQGFQDLVIIPGIEYEVSLKATRRLHDDTPATVDTTIEIVTQAGSDLIVGSTFTRNNTAWNLSEETMIIPASNTEANVRLQFSTTNTTTIGMIIDDLSVVRVNPLGSGPLANADAIATVGIIDSSVTSPQVLISAPTITNNSAFTTTFQFSETVKGFDETVLQVINGTASSSILTGVNTYQVTITADASPLVNSNVEISLPAGAVTAADNDEGSVLASITTIYDVVKPTVSMQPAGINNLGAQTVTIKFSEPAAELTLSELTPEFATISDFNKVDNSTYTLTLDPSDSLVEGEAVSISLAAGVISDAAGNLNEAKTITGTIDLSVPVITLIGSEIVNINLGSVYSEQGASALDNIDGVLTVVIAGDVVDVNKVGDYTVTYNVSDKTGNAAVQITRLVKVTADVTTPVISLIGTNESLELGSVYNEQGASALDNIDGVLTV